MTTAIFIFQYHAVALYYMINDSECLPGDENVNTI